MQSLPAGQASPARALGVVRWPGIEGLRGGGEGWSQVKAQARCPAHGRSCIDSRWKQNPFFFSFFPTFLAYMGWIWGPRGTSPGGDDPEQTTPTQVSGWWQAALQRHEPRPSTACGGGHHAGVETGHAARLHGGKLGENWFSMGTHHSPLGFPFPLPKFTPPARVPVGDTHGKAGLKQRKFRYPRESQSCPYLRGR